MLSAIVFLSAFLSYFVQQILRIHKFIVSISIMSNVAETQPSYLLRPILVFFVDDND